MDLLLHAFWGITIAKYKFPQSKKALIAGGLFGIVPDVFAIPWMFYRNIFKVYDIYQIPGWAATVYSFSHNLFAAGFVFLLVFFINKKYVFLGFAYLVHIITDIFVHCEPIGIRILFPFSNWSYCSPFYMKIRGTSGQAFLSHPGNIALEIVQYLILFTTNILLNKKRNAKAEEIPIKT